MQEDGPLCSVAKFLKDAVIDEMVAASKAENGDLILYDRAKTSGI